MCAAKTPSDAPVSDDIDDLRALEAQAEALRREGRDAAADQLLAWRDLHAMRLARAPKRD